MSEAAEEGNVVPLRASLEPANDEAVEGPGTAPTPRSMRIGVAQPMVSASETSVMVTPASSATASPSATVRTTRSGGMSP